MPDTIQRDFPEVRCNDCGVGNVCFFHKCGALVPAGTEGYFCHTCFAFRGTRADRGQEPLPIGETRYFDRCKNWLVSIRYPTSSIGPGDRSISDAIMDILLKLGLIEMNVTTTDGLEEFYFQWGDYLATDDVERALNRLRAQFPIITIGVKRWQ